MILRLSLSLLAIVLPAASEAECRLEGTWKSDSARTLAAIAARSDPVALNALSNDLFGHMIHEWTCTHMRAWFDDQNPPKPVPYNVVEVGADSIVVSFPESEDVVLRITFEGECYNVEFDEDRIEYFCPHKRGDGA
jgi:hypothetical protein